MLEVYGAAARKSEARQRSLGRQRQEKGAAIRCRSGGSREEVQRERRIETLLP